MTSLGLTLNAEKTRIVDAAEGFNFLGMHFCLKPMRSIRHKIWDAKSAEQGRPYNQRPWEVGRRREGGGGACSSDEPG
jgi:hypothetical protein